MTYLSWDEIGPRVLTYGRRFGGRDPGHAANAGAIYGDHPNEFYQLFSRCHDRADPGRGIGLGGAALAQSPAPAASPSAAPAPPAASSPAPGAGPVSNTRPGPAETPAPAASPRPHR